MGRIFFYFPFLFLCTLYAICIAAACELTHGVLFADSLKSPLQRDREQKIYNELIEVVEERDKLVAMLEEERVR